MSETSDGQDRVRARLKRHRAQTSRNIMASASTISVTVMLFNPLDTLRIRWQVEVGGGSGTSSNLARFSRHIVRTEGLWRGLWAPAIAVNGLSIGISGGLRMGFYPIVRDSMLAAAGRENKNAAFMTFAGFLTGALGYFVTNPLFQMKTRMQAEAGGIGPDGRLASGSRAGHIQRYPSAMGGLMRIAKEEGIGGLFRGSSALMVRGACLTAGQQLGYDGAKTEMKARGWMTEGFALHLVASVCAGFLGTGFSAPADLVMTKWQSAAGTKADKRGLLRFVANMVHEGGPLVLYRGWSLYFVRVAPIYMVFLPAYEQVRWLLGIGYLD